MLRVRQGSRPAVIDLNGRRYEVSPTLDDAGTPAVAALLIARMDGQPLTVADLRATPLARLARLAVAAVHGGSEDLLGELKRVAVPQGRERGDRHYKQVAAVVAAARKRGQPARPAVAKRWAVSLPTADRWIATAKALAYIEIDDLRKGAPKPMRGSTT